MARQQGGPDPKEAALAGARCLNPHPEQVRDPEFLASDFFDARDAVQVKYEMVRKVRPAAPRSPRPPRRSATPGRRTTPRPRRWSPPGWKGWSGPARAARRPQAHRADPHLGRGTAGRRPRAAPGAAAGRLRRPSACARTPGRSSERWPAAGSGTPKAADLSAREERKRRSTGPCPCDLHLATRLLNRAPARMPARSPPPAAGWMPATSNCAMPPCTHPRRRSRSGSACWAAGASPPGSAPWPAWPSRRRRPGARRRRPGSPARAPGPGGR